MRKPAIKPTAFILDAAPLIHLAAGDALAALNGLGPVVVPDIVELEATYFRDKPYAIEIAAWIAAGQQPGLRHPRKAGEIGIAAWLAEARLVQIDNRTMRKTSKIDSPNWLYAGGSSPPALRKN